MFRIIRYNTYSSYAPTIKADITKEDAMRWIMDIIIRENRKVTAVRYFDGSEGIQTINKYGTSVIYKIVL